MVKVGSSTYKGTWDENGKLNGEGEIVNDGNQGSFKGIFVNNVRNGHGVYKWPNDQGEYNGNFIDGMRDTTGCTGEAEEATMVWKSDGQTHTYTG